MDFRSRHDADAYIDRLQLFGIKLGLDNMRRILGRLPGGGERSGFIHLAGSNGKGSTGAMLQAMLRRAGYRVGFYTSPHLIDPRERIRIDGRAVGEERWIELASRVRRAAEAAGVTPTYFEFHTLMALEAFRLAETDFAVWETGMGGRLDATNVIARPEAAVVTGIALEHCGYLGDTLSQIAAEKAGIIKPGAAVFAGMMPAEARAVIAARAAEAGCEFTAIADDAVPPPAPGSTDGAGQTVMWRGEPLRLGLNGGVQRRNLALALTVAEELARKHGFRLADALAGLAAVRWPGRMQQLADGSWIDGGHNPDGIAALAGALAEAFPGERFEFVFGAFADKDAGAELELLAPLAARMIFVPVAGEFSRPCVPPEELAAGWRRSGRGPAETAPDVAAAWRMARPRRVLAGSLYLAGELLRELYGPEAALDIS